MNYYSDIVILQNAHTLWLTCGKPSSKEDVKEFFGGYVGLEVSVEISVVSMATVAGLLGCVHRCGLISILIILLPLLWTAEYCISVAYRC